MTALEYRPIGRTACAILLWFALGAGMAVAETASVIDPTEGLESPKTPAAAPKGSSAAPKATAQPDAALKRARAEAEQRRRANAEARAQAARKQAAERESARLRAIEQARQAEAAAREAAAREADARAAAKKAAAVRAAVARAAEAKAAAARLAAQQEAEAREAAARELADREAAAREAAVKEAAAREAAARLAAAREASDRMYASKELAIRESRAKLIPARETSASELAMRKAPPPVTTFRDCAGCPELVWLPQGEVVMGDASASNSPRPVVLIHYALAVGRFEVTFAQWDACVAAGGCRKRPQDAGWGRGWQPVINVNWGDAQQYVGWLSRSTGRRYRLLTEAEWEYAARAGTDVRYWWGDQAGGGDANCAECGSKWDGRQAAPVGRFAPNPFGLHDMHGNVAEWVEDCFHDRLRDAPRDGRAWTSDCTAAVDTRVVRGGAWHGSARSVRSGSRSSAASDHFDNGIGFRVARTD